MDLRQLIRPIGKTVLDGMIFDEKLIIKNDEISGKLEFKNCHFSYPFLFENVEFEEPILFDHCEFDEISFIATSFRDHFLLNKCVFNRYWVLKNSRFFGKVNIYGNIFREGFSLFSPDKTNYGTNEFHNELVFSSSSYTCSDIS